MSRYRCIAGAILLLASVRTPAQTALTNQGIDLSVRLEGSSAMDRAAAYLMETQGKNGSWHASPAQTALALVALARGGDFEDDTVRRAATAALGYLRNGAKTRKEPSPPDDLPPTVKHLLHEHKKEIDRLLDLTRRTDGQGAGETGNPADAPHERGAAVARFVLYKLKSGLATEPAADQSPADPLDWLTAVFARHDVRALSTREARQFVYVLSRGLSAVPVVLDQEAEEPGSWRRPLVIGLLTTQQGDGAWRPDEASAEKDTDAVTLRTAHNLIALSLALD